jgi:uncharacterized protein (DUF169 family)
MDKEIRAYLGMRHNLVGIKIATKGEAAKDKQPPRRMRFCEMVYEAAKGNSFEAEVEDYSCPNAIVTLGYEEPVYVDVQPRINPSTTKVVKVAPLEELKDPDIVLAILNPKQVMEVSSLLDGMEASFKGSMAVCGEGVAMPYMTKKPNVTFLCGGARTFGDYKDSELVLGAPVKTFAEIAEKIQNLSKTCSALCGCRTSDISPHIVKAFEKLGFEKGTDYFFGKVDDQKVRIYLNKDFKGRIKYVTIHIPIKGDVKVKEPLRANKRGPWSDVSITFTVGETLDIYTGKGLKEAVLDIVQKLREHR